MTETEFEVLVVGGGPAGLSASLYLARFNRRVALFDSGYGRSSWHQVNYNYLGFPGGISARHLRELGRQQLADYPQVTCLDYKVESLRRDNRHFVAEGQAGEWRGKAVILCTGVVDHYPHFVGWEEYVGRTMFWCITCDGYGTKGLSVVVIGNTNDAASEALQLQRFTDKLTVLTNSHEDEIAETFERRLANAGIPLIRDKIEEVIGSNGEFEALVTQSGRRIELDQLFNQQGATPQSKLAVDVGAKVTPAGYIVVDNDQQTSIPGLFAAGDVDRLHSHQVSAAAHEGGQAASAANYYLYPPELKDD